MCSEHGACSVNGSLCTCHEGFTGFNSFVYNEGISCHTNTTLLVILNVTSFVCVSLLWIYFIPGGYSNTRAIFVKYAKGLRISKLERHFLIVIFIYCAVVIPSSTTYYMISILDTDAKLGFSTPLSAAYLATLLGYFSALNLFQNSFLNSLVQASNFKWTRFFAVLSILGFLLSVLSVMIPFAYSLLDTDLDNGNNYLVFQVHMITFALGLLIPSLFSLIGIIQTRKIVFLAPALESDQGKQILTRIRKLEVETLLQGIAQAVLYLLFAFYPGAVLYFDAFIPVSWAAGTLVFFRIFKTFAENIRTPTQ